VTFAVASLAFAALLGGIVSLKAESIAHTAFVEQIPWIGASFLAAILIEVLTKPQRADIPSRLLVTIARFAALSCTVGSFAFLLGGIAANPDRCVEQRRTATDTANSLRERSVDRYLACLEQMRTDVFQVQLSLAEKELTREAGAKLLDTARARCEPAKEAIARRNADLDEAMNRKCEAR
jgi:hypothetical protein